jgi:hypothetical protein
VSYQTQPFTLDTNHPPDETILAQGMDAQTATDIAQAVGEVAQITLNLDVTLTGYDATAEASNLPPDPDVYYDWGDGQVDLMAPGTATAAHTYTADGVYLARVIAGDQAATYEVFVNWPPPFPDNPVPFP